MGFTRRREDFTCAHCGRIVKGNGYTNHCPRCLHSLHVDVDPGDRAEECRGLMVPVSVTMESRGYVLTHRCASCGATRRCRSASADSVAEIQAVARSFAAEA